MYVLSPACKDASVYRLWRASCMLAGNCGTPRAQHCWTPWSSMWSSTAVSAAVQTGQPCCRLSPACKHAPSISTLPCCKRCVCYSVLHVPFFFSSCLAAAPKHLHICLAARRVALIRYALVAECLTQRGEHYKLASKAWLSLTRTPQNLSPMSSLSTGLTQR